MTRLSRTTVAALALAALAAPATALAADAHLQGAPTLRVVDADQATLRFVLDQPLPRKTSGSIDARVHFADQGASSISGDGRHDKGYGYAAGVKSAHRLRVGQQYTVKIVVAGSDEAIVRRVRLRKG
jgi:hypothetical protein